MIKRKGQIGFGLRDPGQVVTFAENAGQAVDPAQFGSYETAKKTLETQLKINIQKDVIDQLQDGVSVSVAPSGGKVAVKGQVKDAAAFKKSLAKVTKLLPADHPELHRQQAEDLALGRPLRGQTPHAARSPTGWWATPSCSPTARPRRGRWPRRPTATVPGAKGALAMQADAEQVVVQALKQISALGPGSAAGPGRGAGRLAVRGTAGRPDRLRQGGHQRHHRQGLAGLRLSPALSGPRPRAGAGGRSGGRRCTSRPRPTPRSAGAARWRRRWRPPGRAAGRPARPGPRGPASCPWRSA